MSYHTDHARELSLDRGEAKYWDSDMDANDPGYTFKNVDNAANWANAKGFLDKYLDKETRLEEQKRKAERAESTRETAKELGKTWQSGKIGENLSFLAQSGSNQQPMVIGAGGAGQQQSALGGAASGAMTGAQVASIVPGVGTGVGALVGAGLGAFGLL